MAMRFALVVIVLHLLGQKCTAVQAPVCQPQPSCSECIRSPGCAWCKKKDFLKVGEPNEGRCDSLDSLKMRNCGDILQGNKDVIHFKSSMQSLKNNDLNSDSNNVVQLKPQGIKVFLRVGEPLEFDVEFKRAEGFPIDLYYLMDLSYSMKDDLEKIKNLGQDILTNLQKVTQTVRIGFGSFVDKEKLPYVSQVKLRKKNPCPNRMDTCQPAFTFRNVLPLTKNAKEFKTEVSKQKISGNLDSPEAGLDAIMQAAVCQQEINWANVTRILVYTSDDTFHMAGDGRLAGIFQPHDGKCHLNSDGLYDGTAYDYPSVGQLSRILQSNNIQLIFAVTEKIFPAYQALSTLIPQSVVGVLKDDSSNVVHLISEAYGNLSSTLLLEQNHTPAGLNVSYMSFCTMDNKPSTDWQQKGECTGIKYEKVKFKVRLNASECLKEAEMFEIRMQGISEVLKVTVETICTCNCEDEEKNSKHCNGSGTYLCGVCSCNEGFEGRECGCESKGIVDYKNETFCRKDSTSQICSGHGTCECKRCACSPHFSGEYCECDHTSCEYHNNKMCNGQGECQCGKCKCGENYTGSACECSKYIDKCPTKHRVLCSGQGKCECNRCVCNEGFIGDDCSVIANPCQKYRGCVDCKVDPGKFESCSEACGSVQLLQLKGNHELQCTAHSAVSFNVSLNSAGIVLIQYADLPRTIDKTTVIIGTSVSAIMLIGIIIIIIYRVLLEVYYQREYHSFLKSQEQNKWKEGNPLYREATTTVLNPLHIQDG